MNICFAGDGWGGVAAFKSLIEHFDRLYVVSNDIDVIACLRDVDTLITDFNDSASSVVVLCGYNKIIKEDLLSNRRYVNVHYSLLPKYRGRHSVVWAVINGETQFGVTIHEVNKYVDDGDIIHQHTFEAPSLNSREIIERCNEFVKNKLGEIIHCYVQGEIKTISQNKNNATWVPKRDLYDCIVDFGKSNKYLDSFFRALVRPYPLPMLAINKVLYEIVEYKLLARENVCGLGRVVNIDCEGVWITVSDGFLIVKNVLLDKVPVKLSSVFRVGMKL